MRVIILSETELKNIDNGQLYAITNMDKVLASHEIIEDLRKPKHVATPILEEAISEEVIEEIIEKKEVQEKVPGWTYYNEENKEI